jgi:hypothetical protein
VDIHLLYVADCPNHAIARVRVDIALERTQLVAIVREREVQSGEEAERLGMHGSPTILIDGHDPFAGIDDPATLSCRLYPGAQGFNGAPTVEQLVEALGA